MCVSVSALYKCVSIVCVYACACSDVEAVVVVNNDGKERDTDI